MTFTHKNGENLIKRSLFFYHLIRIIKVFFYYYIIQVKVKRENVVACHFQVKQ